MELEQRFADDEACRQYLFGLRWPQGFECSACGGRGVWKGSRNRLLCTSCRRTGRGRVFRNSELTPDVLLASACLPTMFQAVEIDGDAYWDGGYAGNPTMTPLIRECAASDTILVQVNPVERTGTPRTARDIL